MGSSTREDWVEGLDALDAALERVLELNSACLLSPERLALLQRLEHVRRVLPAVEHPLINELGHALPEEIGGRRWRWRIGCGSRRVRLIAV